MKILEGNGSKNLMEPKFIGYEETMDPKNI